MAPPIYTFFGIFIGASIAEKAAFALDCIPLEGYNIFIEATN